MCFVFGHVNKNVYFWVDFDAEHYFRRKWNTPIAKPTPVTRKNRSCRNFFIWNFTFPASRNLSTLSLWLYQRIRERLQHFSSYPRSIPRTNTCFSVFLTIFLLHLFHTHTSILRSYMLLIVEIQVYLYRDMQNIYFILHNCKWKKKM